MGEYARYLNRDIKIGTCENMYYLRYEDRDRVKQLPGNVDPLMEKDLRFRLPYPDEDDKTPGSYDNAFRTEALHKPELWEKLNYGIRTIRSAQYFSMPELADNTGIVQASHNNGYLLNVKCYHGIKLPIGSEDVKIFWNGKASDWIHLAFIKNTPEGLKAIITCKYCRKEWNVDFSEIIEWISDLELRSRFQKYIDIGEAQ